MDEDDQDTPGSALASIQMAGAIEAFANVLDELEIPAGERNGILRRLGRRLKTKTPDKIDTKWLLSQIDEKLALSLSYLDEFTLARANARDLASVVSVLVDRRQLLKGEPTQIVSTEDRRKLNDLIPLMMKEAQRRGVMIDLSSEDYEEIGKNQEVLPPPEKKSLLRKKNGK